MNLVDTAKEYALKMHGCQDHGCLTIDKHLEAVVGKITEVYNSGETHTLCSLEYLQCVGWLHDVLEDTKADREEMENLFGPSVVDDVERVTDGPGKNRMERHLNTYYRTRLSRAATLVKMCDRWHNQGRSIVNREKFAKMYAKEYIYFKFALFEPGFNDKLWAELDAQYEELKKIAYEN